MDLKESGCNGMGWIQFYSEQNPIVNAYKHNDKPISSVKCEEFSD
jgi:hypothetical protein